MNEWILIIMILTSNGWVKNEVKNWEQYGVGLYGETILPKNKNAGQCYSKAKRINQVGGNGYQFIHAYCIEEQTND